MGSAHIAQYVERGAKLQELIALWHHFLHISIYCPLYISFENGWIIFKLGWIIDSPQKGNVQNLCCPCSRSRSSSHLRFKYMYEVFIKDIGEYTKSWSNLAIVLVYYPLVGIMKTINYHVNFSNRLILSKGLVLSEYIVIMDDISVT